MFYKKTDFLAQKLNSPPQSIQQSYDLAIVLGKNNYHFKPKINFRANYRYSMQFGINLTFKTYERGSLGYVPQN